MLGRDAYFGLNECTEEELEQLRNQLFWSDGDDLESFSREDMEIIENCEFPEDIPFELLEKAFGMYSFVDEDFWCNC